MTGKRPHSLFITGTNTGVGKTFVAAALARTLVAQKLRVGVYKPVMSGCRSTPSTLPNPSGAPEESAFDATGDDVALWLAAGSPGKLSQVAPQQFRAPLAPPLAARAEGRSVDRDMLRTGLLPWLTESDWVIVEGAGGLFSPIADHELNADLAYDMGMPLVLVARNTLGVIHATLATLYAARTFRGGLPVAAVILNDVPQDSSDGSCQSNFEEIVRWCAPCPVWRHGTHETHAPQLAAWLRESLAVAHS